MEQIKFLEKYAHIISAGNFVIGIIMLLKSFPLNIVTNSSLEWNEVTAYVLIVTSIIGFVWYFRNERRKNKELKAEEKRKSKELKTEKKRKNDLRIKIMLLYLTKNSDNLIDDLEKKVRNELGFSDDDAKTFVTACVEGLTRVQTLIDHHDTNKNAHGRQIYKADKMRYSIIDNIKDGTKLDASKFDDACE